MTARIARATTVALAVLAVALAASTLLAGLHDVSRAWDVWYYHLPFGARIAGLVGPDEYVLHAANRARLEGFPLLTELLQGLLFRIAGRPEAANLVAMGSLALYVAFCRRALGVPVHVAFLALMAIPLVQIHATACYVDLPANLALSALVLSVVRLHASPDPPPRWAGHRLLALAALAANMKFQLHPLVALALVAAAPRVLPPLVRARDARALAALAAIVPLVGATFLKNAVLHHNPYYPIRLALGPLALPGPDTPYSSSPPYLEHAPRAVRFLFSILEIGIRPFDDRRRWTIDQWAPSDSPALRMGGFFGAYVVFQVGVLVWRVVRPSPPGPLSRCAGEGEERREEQRPPPSPAERERGAGGVRAAREREARVAAIAFALFTAVLANLPQSHELRYYMSWMIVLVTINLRLVTGTPAATRPPWLGLVCTGFLAAVLWVNKGGYVYPSGVTFAEMLREDVDAKVIDSIQEGERVCLRREPWTFLYAARFHGGKRYVVKEAEGEAECGGWRWIP